MRAERKWKGVKGGVGGKVTEMLKNERRGGEIISRYKSREWDTPAVQRLAYRACVQVQLVQNFFMLSSCSF